MNSGEDEALPPYFVHDMREEGLGFAGVNSKAHLNTVLPFAVLLGGKSVAGSRVICLCGSKTDAEAFAEMKNEETNNTRGPEPETNGS